MSSVNENVGLQYSTSDHCDCTVCRTRRATDITTDEELSRTSFVVSRNEIHNLFACSICREAVDYLATATLYTYIEIRL